jgi:hypothetical protein
VHVDAIIPTPRGTSGGSSQRRTEAFYASPERREAAVRADVSQPLRAAGYSVIHTGGGCLAWFRPISANGEDHILITVENDIDGDPEAREWIIGRYQLNGWVNIDETFTLDEAITYAELLPPLVSPDGEPIEELYPTLAAARFSLLGEKVDDA